MNEAYLHISDKMKVLQGKEVKGEGVMNIDPNSPCSKLGYFTIQLFDDKYGFLTLLKISKKDLIVGKWHIVKSKVALDEV